jgi:hypothetical protein
LLLDKRKYLFFIMIFLIVLSLFGCSEKEANQPKGKEKNNTIETESKEKNEIEIVKLDRKTVINITVSRVGESLLDVREPHVTYHQYNSIELKTFVNAIQRAEKMKGIFDMKSPNYLITITFEDKTFSRYLLWLHNDGGSFMNEKDLNTLYKLPTDLIVDFSGYVQ